MKNKLFILGLTALSMLASCSSEDALVDNPVIGPENPDTTVVYQNSQVPIRLGTPSLSSLSVTTRSAILSDPNDLSFVANNVLVYGLAYAEQTNAVSALPITWEMTGNTPSNPYAICVNGVKASGTNVPTDPNDPNDPVYMHDSDGNRIQATDSNGQLVFEEDGTTPVWMKQTMLNWDDNVTRYYPMGGWYKYNFYGIWPSTNTTIVSGETTIDAVVNNLDGETDVIWGRTRPDATEIAENAYSANYFNVDLHPENKDTIPTIRMKHLLTRFRFKVVEGADFGGTENVEEQGLQIVDIKVVAAPTQGKVTFARLNDAAGEGVLTVTETSGTADIHLKVGDTPENAFGGYIPVTSAYKLIHHDTDKANYPIYLGGDADGIMLPAIKVSDSNTGYHDGTKYTQTYALIVKMKDKNDREYVNEVPFLIQKPEDEQQINGYYFAPGYSYWVTLTVNALKEIEARATLDTWIDAPGDISMEF